MRLDGDHEGLDFAVRRLRHLRRPPPDEALGRQEQDIPDQWPNEAFEQRRHARSDALEGGDRRKQREQDLGPHGAGQIAPLPVRRALPSLASGWRRMRR